MGNLFSEENARRKRGEKQFQWTWVCALDSESCAQCKAMDGVGWRPQETIATKPPLNTCTSRKGCRCRIVAEYDIEGAGRLTDSRGKQ